MVRFFLVSIICLQGLFTLRAQQTSTLRSRYIIPADTVRIDSLSIQPGTFQIDEDSLLMNCYSIDELRAMLIRKPDCAGIFPDSVKVSYRILPIAFYQAYFTRNRVYSRPDERGIYNPFVFSPDERIELDKGFKGLEKNGSISRGISLGNNQDMSVASTLNLQLAGKLTPEIDINAAITDDNIPIQPDGTTQQLQDFDKVYIELSNTSSRLIVGDFQTSRPESYFVKFNKRLQGLGYQTKYNSNFGKKGHSVAMKTSLNTAIARGRFQRNQIQGQEGNQGPYRLQGASNEQFIIVLSGSEKVYIDGKLLKRGQEYDYTIDYNAAEITFTTHQFITKDKRIFVEFEYSDRNYARTLVFLSQEFHTGKMKNYLNLYSEQDSKNQPLQQKLEGNEKTILREAGDDLQKAVISSIDSTGYRTELIQYRMQDTLVGGVLYANILVYSTDPNQAVYRATFSRTAPKQGNYIQINSAANGRVFQWVAPINGAPQGSYEPIIQLIPPTQQQIISWGNEYKISDHLVVNSEVSWSRYDKNTFSKLDQQDDQAYAFRFSAHDVRTLGKDSIPFQLQTTLSYEQVDRNYNPIERFRNVEFERDWNLQNINAGKQTEYLPKLNIVLRKGSGKEASYLFNALIRGTESTASRHSFQLGWINNKTELRYAGSLTQTQTHISGADFYRHKSRVSQKIGYFRVGYEDEFEQNKIADRMTDTLLRTSYRFFDRQVFLSNADTLSQKFNLFYRVRTDEGIDAGRLQNYARAEQYGFSFDIHRNEQIRLSSLTTYRSLSVSDTGITALKPDQNIANRIELSLRFFKSALTSASYYELGSGQETRKEFIYLEVQPGQGVYQWTDYNNNGVRELNEFEIAAFPDQSKFIRIYTPTQDFIRVYFNQFNEIFNLRSPVSWQNSKGFKKLLSRLSLQSALRLDSRSMLADFLKAADPFSSSVTDSLLITLNQSFRNSLFFNKSSPVFGFDLNWQQLASKALLNNGIESRNHRFFQHKIRWYPGHIFGINLEFRGGNKESQAAFFGNRNYQIRYIEYEPSVSVQSGSVFRMTVRYKQGRKQNEELLGNEKALVQNGGIEMRYNVVSKGSLQLAFNLVQISYNGTQNSPVGFEMLDGLRAGKNFTWNASYQRTLSNNMQIGFSYDGRKSPNTPMVHVGNAQIRVFF